MVTTRSKQAQNPNTDRARWEVIFKALKQMLHKQQTQIDTLLQDNKFLQQRINTQHESWDSDVFLFQDQISMLWRNLELAKLAKLVEVVKGELMLVSRKKKAFVYDDKLGHARDELDDFKAWFDILSHRCSDKEVTNTSDVSGLQTEIKFVWYQYNEMERNYTKQLQAKSMEVDEASEKIVNLLARLEQVQSSKDELVGTLRTDIIRLEDEARKKDEKISTFSKELDLLKSKNSVRIPALQRCSEEPSSSSFKRSRNSMNGECDDLEKESSSAQIESTVATLKAKINELEAETSHKSAVISTLLKELNALRSKTAIITPVLGRCTNEPTSSRLRGRGNGSTRGPLVPKEEASSEKGCRRSKRKQDNDTPKLITPQFKFPKLKSQSPRGR